MTIRNTFLEHIHSSVKLQGEISANNHFFSNFERIVESIITRLSEGGRLFVAGNGGSAAEAQHLAAELGGRYLTDRAPLPSEALNSDIASLTAIANDYGYDEIFSRQILAKARSSDCFLALTTSGQSANIVSALKMCRKIGVESYCFAGRGGGVASNLADIALVVPSSSTALVQEVHLSLIHCLCESVEKTLFPADF